MKNTVNSITDPNAREILAAQFMLRMYEKYGADILASLEDEEEIETEEEI